jgi:hypothetical protein
VHDSANQIIQHNALNFVLLLVHQLLAPPALMASMLADDELILCVSLPCFALLNMLACWRNEQGV